MAFTRRAFLASSGVTAAAAAAAGVGYAAGRDGTDEDGTPGGASHIVPFHGAHQAGIATPAQDRLHFAAFDVADGSDLRELMREWTRAAARMTAGRPAGADPGDALAPPEDTGEALDLTPARLTVTF